MKKKRLPYLIIGLLILSVFILMAIFPRVFTSVDRKQSFGIWLPPSAAHPLGTNSLGYDIYAELVYGARDTLLVGLLSGLLSLFAGVMIGVLSSLKGFIGVIFRGLTDIFVMIPRLIALIVLSAFIGSSTVALVILIALFGWAKTAREVSAEITRVKALPFTDSCKMYGYSGFHTAVYHLLPNVGNVVVSRFLLGVNSCIMTESALSFLGFGDLYYPTWGVMINFARSRGALINSAYLYMLAPGFCIMLVSLSFYFISVYIDGKRHALPTAK